jgi:chromosome partitioning protein
LKTIVITSQKGGSGKTTLAAHLAVEAERVGDAPAWLIDTDRQATLSRWHDRREGETPQRADVPFTRLEAGLAALAGRGAAYCFIDTPPTISDQNATVVNLADLVLIPVRLSPADLWAVAQTVALAKDAGKTFLFVITQAKSNATITAQTIAALSEHGRVAPSFIADRVPYAVAMTGGRTAPELSPSGPAAAELAALWRDLKSCIPESVKADFSENMKAPLKARAARARTLVHG